MNIVVCVKQVPDTAHIKFDDAGNLVKDGLEYMINPFCEYAVETAIRIKEAMEGECKITVFSIGPSQAKEAIKKAVAMGCDEAFLLSDEKFQGADAWAVAYTLSEAIKNKVPNADLIFFGQFATDGNTGLTGPMVAEFMSLPSLTFCKQVEYTGSGSLKLHRETERGSEVHEMTLPGVVCMMKCDYDPRMPTIKGVMKANRTQIPEVSAEELGLDVTKIGIQGSPTMVMNTWKKPKKEGGVKIDGSDPQEAVKQLIGFLQEQKVM